MFWTITPQICNHSMIPKFTYVNLKKPTQGFVGPYAKPDVQILRQISINHKPRSTEKYGKGNSKISLDKLGDLVDRLLWNAAGCILSLKWWAPSKECFVNWTHNVFWQLATICNAEKETFQAKYGGNFHRNTLSFAPKFAPPCGQFCTFCHLVDNVKTTGFLPTPTFLQPSTPPPAPAPTPSYRFPYSPERTAQLPRAMILFVLFIGAPRTVPGTQ